jgi:catechol 2,3-dioxygenase-like lactoylglutathione lyase family enzyme
MNQRTKKKRQPFAFVLKTFLGLFFSLVVLMVILVKQSDAPAKSQGLSSSVPTLQFHHVTLSVKNVDQVSQWYADLLGFTVRDHFILTRPDGKSIRVARVEIPGLRMNISQFDGSIEPERTGERQGLRHLALQVDSVDQTYQSLREKGVQFMSEPFTYDPPGYRVAFFQDLEGNIIELYQDQDQE